MMFSGFYSVREDYQLAPGNVIIGSGGVARWHAPMAHTELPQMVAKLETAGIPKVLEFYRTYGDLGQPELVPELGLYRWPDGQETMNGDSLDWVRSHAYTVRRCLEITDALQTNGFAWLERFTTDRTHHPFAERGRIERSSPDYLSRAGIRPREVARLTPSDRGRRLRASLINRNIEGIHRYLSWKADGTDQSFFKFSAQIEAVYWHLANAVDGGMVARCKRPGCGALFIQRHRSQTYCAPRFGQRESPCSIWVRQQRHAGSSPLQQIATDSKTARTKAPQVLAQKKKTPAKTRRGSKRA